MTSGSIIDRFGGTRAMAVALGLPPSTVQSWKAAGLIPAKHQQFVLNRAREIGINLDPSDFFEGASTNESRGSAAA
jgi:hypothetical protein